MRARVVGDARRHRLYLLVLGVIATVVVSCAPTTVVAGADRLDPEVAVAPDSAQTEGAQSDGSATGDDQSSDESDAGDAGPSDTDEMPSPTPQPLTEPTTAPDSPEQSSDDAAEPEPTTEPASSDEAGEPEPTVEPDGTSEDAQPEPTSEPTPTTEPEDTDAAPEPTPTTEVLNSESVAPTPTPSATPFLEDETDDDDLFFGEGDGVVAPDDGDSRDNPATEDDENFLIGSVSSPEGDASDWSTFETGPEGPSFLALGVFCDGFESTDGSGVLTVTLYRGTDTVVTLTCTSDQFEDFGEATLESNSTYLVEATFSGNGYTDWFFGIQDLD